MLLQCKLSLLSALALATLVPVLVASSAAQQLRDNNPDVIEVRSYKLTMANVDRYAAATAALEKLVNANPALKQGMNSVKTHHDKTLTQTAAEWDLHFPQVTAVLRSNSLSTREYLVISLALMNDVMMVAMKKQGDIKDYPANAISPENAAFVEQNYSKLTEIMKTIESESADQQ